MKRQLCVCLLLLLCACTTTTPAVSSEAAVSSETGEIATVPPIGANEMVSDCLLLDDGRVVYLLQTTAGMIRQGKQRLLLWDPETGTALADAVVECARPALSRWKGGVCLTAFVEEYATDGSNRTTKKTPLLIAYDADLKEAVRPDLSSLATDYTAATFQDVRALCMDDAGKRLAWYAIGKGVCLADCENVAGAEFILSPDGNERINSVTALGFSESGDALYFLCKYVEGSASYNGYGRVRLTDGDVSAAYPNRKMTESLVLGGDRLLTIDEADSETGQSVVVTGDGKVTLTYQNRIESSLAVLSAHGKYVLSLADGQTPEGKPLMRASLYDAATGDFLRSWDRVGEGDVLIYEALSVNEKAGYALVCLFDGNELIPWRLDLKEVDR